MKTTHKVLSGGLLWFALSSMSMSVIAGLSDIRLVDGTATRGQVLFRHPNAELLIVRSAGNRTVQSIPLALIQAVRAPDGQVQQFSPARDLTADEKRELERNQLWADQPQSGELARWADEEWEDRPLIVWAHPGESGNAMQADNWLDQTGRPLTESPWSDEPFGGRGGADRHSGRFDGDVLLPAADREYIAIQPGDRDALGAYMIRHLTVERNARYFVRYTVSGNLWVKDGAFLGQGSSPQTGGFGNRDSSQHTFARFCNYHDQPEPRSSFVDTIAHWLHIDTGENSSLEIIGKTGGPSDRFTLARGTLIIAEDSFIGNGNRGSFYTREGTTTVLLDGAGVGCPAPIVTGDNGTYGIGGTLMFGHPDKPLTRDLVFSGAYFHYDRINPNAAPSQRTSGASFVLGPNGRMEVHSVDPTRARVIFRPRSRQRPGPSVAPWHGRFVHRNRPADPELWEQPGVPTGVVAVFRGETEFDGVVFDGFYKGGIMVDPAAAARWRNVSFGDRNHGPPHSLIAHLPARDLASRPAVELDPKEGAYLPRGQTARVTMAPARPDLEVRYTLDGSVPDRDSPRYTEPLSLTETTIVTAGGFKDGFLYGLPVRAEFRFNTDYNRAAVAEISASASFGQNPPRYANDLDETTYWRGGAGNNQYLDLTWPDKVSFNRVRVRGRNIRIWRILIDDNGDWRELASGESTPVDAQFPLAQAARLRFLVVEVTGDRPVVNQIEVLQTE